MSVPWSLRVLSGVAGVEGAALVGYAVLDVVLAIRSGLAGSSVSNVPAFLVQVGLFLVLGWGMVAVARGWWRRRRWARAPFIFGQLLALVVGIPLAQSSGLVQIIGAALAAVAAIGIVISLLPVVTRSLESGQADT